MPSVYKQNILFRGGWVGGRGVATKLYPSLPTHTHLCTLNSYMVQHMAVGSTLVHAQAPHLGTQVTMGA